MQSAVASEVRRRPYRLVIWSVSGTATDGNSDAGDINQLRLSHKQGQVAGQQV